MNILFYEPAITEKGKAILREIVDHLTLEEKFEVYQTIDSFSHRLNHLIGEPTITILFINTKEDLLELLSIKHLLFDTKIILILPDQEEDTIAKGHSLRPRFLTFSNSDLKEVSAVFNKILKKHTTRTSSYNPFRKGAN